MPWFKVDDNLAFHQKVVAAGNAAMGLWVRAGSWSAQQLTDGFVPDHIVTTLGGRKHARRLTEVGLWSAVEGGFQFHEWTDRQPTRIEVEEDRKAARQRMRDLRKNRRKEATGSEDVRPNTARTSESVRDPRPDPTRPSAAAAAETPPLPPAVEILKGKLDAARMVVRWDRLTAEQFATIEALIATHGDGPLVKAAIASHRPDSPASFAQAWLKAWESLPEPGAGLRLVRARCDTHDWVQIPAGGTCPSCASEQIAAR